MSRLTHFSPNTYESHFSKISKVIEESAWEQMQLAGIEEKRLALETGDIDSDEILVSSSCRWSMGKTQL
jgi:hypothetical protein